MATKSLDSEAPSRQSKRARRNDEEVSELEMVPDIDPDLDEFLDDNDSTPGDRRRDPLRRP